MSEGQVFRKGTSVKYSNQFCVELCISYCTWNNFYINLLRLVCGELLIANHEMLLRKSLTLYIHSRARSFFKRVYNFINEVQYTNIFEW